MAIQKAQAILLYKRDIRETSSIAVFYTDNFGKIKGLIKGVRGPEAKFGLYLTEFARFDIVYYEKRRADTYMVTQCDLKDPYNEIADDLRKRLTSYYALELVDKFTPLEEPSNEIYRLLIWFLEYMRSERFVDKAIIIFQLKLLEYCGFLPNLKNCVNCSREIAKEGHFSIRIAGLLCSGCESADTQAFSISRGAAASINMIRRYSIARLGRMDITVEITKELNRILEKFVLYHLGEHLKSCKFLSEAISAGVV